MTTLSLLLVLGAAFVHAGWNFLFKLIGSRGVGVIWLFSFLYLLIFLPIVVFFLMQNPLEINNMVLLFLGGNALLHITYFLLLQYGYQHGDLSVVYPLARGTGPMLSTFAAVLFLGETPTPLALTGAGLIIIGVFLLSGGKNTFQGGTQLTGVGIGLLTGMIIAGYTIWDKIAVSVVLITPLYLDYGGNIGRAILLLPGALRERKEVLRVWKTYPLHILGIATLSPMAYIMVLTAMKYSPVSYIAPAREVSTLIGVFLGVFILKEGTARERIPAGLLIAAGVILLAIN